MPSTSKKQHNFMAAVANNPEFAKKAGVPKTVGEDFMAADKGKKFRVGGAKPSKKEGINKQKTNRGSRQLPNAMLNKYIGHNDGGMMKHDDMKMDKKTIKKAVGMHDKQQHGGKKTSLTKLASGGKAGQLSKANGIAVKGKSKGTMITMKKGGKC